MKLSGFVGMLLGASLGCLSAIVAADETGLALSTSLSAPIQGNKAPSAVAQQQADQASVNLLAQALEDYRIGPSDLIEISVFQVPELSRTVRVGARGTLTLPLVGQIDAGGLTGQELEALIASKLKQSYLQDPQVSVFIKEYISQRVTVEGSVNHPGVFPISGKTTLLQAIALAGGLDRLADTKDIKVFRERESSLRESVQYDIEPIRKGLAQDPVLQTNDVVVVGRSNARATLKDVTETLRDLSIFGLFF